MAVSVQNKYKAIHEKYKDIIQHTGVVAFIDFFSEFIPHAVKTQWDERKIKMMLKNKIRSINGKIVVVVDGGSKNNEIKGYKKGIASWQVFYITEPDFSPHENPSVIGVTAYRTLQSLRSSKRIKIISEWGMEADDLIIFLSELRATQGLFSQIYSKDKDIEALWLVNEHLIPKPSGKIMIVNGYKKPDTKKLYDIILRKISGYDSDMPDSEKNLKENRKKYPSPETLVRGIVSGEIPQFLAIKHALDLSGQKFSIYTKKEV